MSGIGYDETLLFIRIFGGKKMEFEQVHILNQLHQCLWETHGKHGKYTNKIRATFAPSSTDAKCKILHRDGLQIKLDTL